MICPISCDGHHKGGWLCLLQVLAGMIVKIMMAVSNARKAGSEQWVRMKKQIKTAREIMVFKFLYSLLEENVATSIKIKDMSTL